jgi:hypothetical protein
MWIIGKDQIQESTPWPGITSRNHHREKYMWIIGKDKIQESTLFYYRKTYTLISN